MSRHRARAPAAAGDLRHDLRRPSYSTSYLAELYGAEPVAIGRSLAAVADDVDEGSRLPAHEGRSREIVRMPFQSCYSGVQLTELLPELALVRRSADGGT